MNTKNKAQKLAEEAVEVARQAATGGGGVDLAALVSKLSCSDLDVLFDQSGNKGPDSEYAATVQDVVSCADDPTVTEKAVRSLTTQVIRSITWPWWHGDDGYVGSDTNKGPKILGKKGNWPSTASQTIYNHAKTLGMAHMASAELDYGGGSPTFYFLKYPTVDSTPASIKSVSSVIADNPGFDDGWDSL